MATHKTNKATSTEPEAATIPAKRVPDGRDIAKMKQSARSKKNILAAASKEFGSKGLSGARVTSIAKRAGMNVQALYHHFGNKEQLYSAVIEDAFLREWDDAVSEQVSQLPADAALRYLWSTMFQGFGADRVKLALLGDINTHRARHLRRNPAIKAYFQRFIAEQTAILERGGREGVFQPGLDSPFVYMVLSGVVGNFVNHAHSLEAILDRDLREKGVLELFQQQVIEFVLRAIRA
ncbi:TetR/AcrR family transcriptional regulator [Novosphingobium sp. BL-52-GroH]|uniref:TetR/AcrR family transcriptional regulator n=1 Tax=Novosphingobium sp. BL-52-GroH TaxID=3349877 RepID=UPI00384CFD1F